MKSQLFYLALLRFVATAGFISWVSLVLCGWKGENGAEGWGKECEYGVGGQRGMVFGWHLTLGKVSVHCYGSL